MLRALAGTSLLLWVVACGKTEPPSRPDASASRAPTPSSSLEAPLTSSAAPAPPPPQLPTDRSFQRPSAERIVAIGDLHGDVKAARSALRLGGAIDEAGKWIGGALVVVQTGDQLDRGDDEPQILDLFARLEREAKAAGGALYPLDGNHEVMNLLGHTRDATPAIYATFADDKSESRRQDEWEDYSKLAAAKKKGDAVPAVYGQTRDAWMAAHPPGYVEYRANERGLVNQGWKDSFDAVSHADGELAVGPIALCEVQGYVYAARRAAAYLASELGKTGVGCADRAGFIVNALLFPYLNDSVKMLEASYATADDIDAAMKLGCGYPMGPFELLDVVGLDVSLAIQRELYLELREPGFSPAPLLEHLVTAGYLGRKTGRGFRDHTHR